VNDCIHLTRELQCWVAVVLHDSDRSTRMNFVSISRHQGVPLPANQRTHILYSRCSLQISNTRMTDYRISARSTNKVLGFPYSSNAGKKAESLNLRHPALSQTKSPSQRSRQPLSLQREATIHSYVMATYSTTFTWDNWSTRRIGPITDALPPFHCTAKPRSTTIMYLFTRANGRLLGGGGRLVTRAARDMEAGSEYEDGYDG
jgi:hypothetical protein